MPIEGLFDPTTFLLQKVLDLRVLRHNLIVSNIAHQDTPGYQSQDLYFEDALRAAVAFRNSRLMVQTHPQHLPVSSLDLDQAQVQLISTPSPSMGLDLNSVHIEREMAALAENTIQYQATAQILAKKFGLLKQAIREGGR